MPLSNKENNRYSRQLLLDKVGMAGQLKLKKAKTLVIGAGGLGCPILMYLTAAGVGTIGIIDFDTIDESNLQRQILFDTADVGKSKSITAKQKLESQNPLIKIEAFNYALSNQNAIELFSNYDIIIDGTDNFSTRYMVSDACVLANKPLVYGAIHKFEGQVSVFNYKNGPTYRCLFPTPPVSGSIPSCSEVGVIGVLPGTIGTQQANEAIKMILEIGNVMSGRLLIYDSLQPSFLEIKIQKSVELVDFGISNISDFENYDYSFSCETDTIEKGITKSKLMDLSSNTLVLDVREDWEKPKITNKQVINIPLDELDDHIDDIPKDKTIYVVCQKGGRSQSAIDFLKKEYNYTNLINVDGGLL
jgi:molybdopterin/thiamine biosynthesis adenylyltransferase/rhodanese-related sulfurtransferase